MGTFTPNRKRVFESRPFVSQLLVEGVGVIKKSLSAKCERTEGVPQVLVPLCEARNRPVSSVRAQNLKKKEKSRFRESR